jgi:putative SOS response-associated peptidase YedK
MRNQDRGNRKKDCEPDLRATPGGVKINRIMCGRFTLRRTNLELAQTFYARFQAEWRPRFNIAPTQQVLAIRESPTSGKAQGLAMHWGLIPPWASDTKNTSQMIHASAEALLEKRSHQPFALRRCLVLADGWFEWREFCAGNKPYFVHRKDDQPFAFAGLWQAWRKGATPVRSCKIITTAANQLMQPLHHRMPVILPSHAYARWLDGSFPEAERLLSDLAPYDWYEMEAYPVSQQVNDASYDEPNCVVECRT